MSASSSANVRTKGATTLKKPEKIFTYQGSAAVYAGAVPNDGDTQVVVFVPGLGQSASFFWGDNSMYEKAYRNGFRTAFANFDIPDGKSKDMWSNGEVLAKQITDICAYYKTPRVVIVAHSKGGVDAQTAAVYFGAGNLIERIITLSTPHWGSQLADIAYSSAGFALAELIKAHSPGCFAMQTGYMSQYRSMTDESHDNIAPIYTFAGNGGDKEFSKIWAGSLMLDRYGENDGVVTVQSAHNPKGEHLGTLHLNHEQMGGGEFVWSHLEPAISGTTVIEAVPASAVPYCAPPAQILKGGRLEKGVNESFNVDSAVEDLSISITIAGSTLPKHFSLKAPDGIKVHLAAKRTADGVVRLRAAVHSPKVGRWKLTASSAHGAYCALLSLHGKNISCSCPECAAQESIGADLRILRTYSDGYDVVGEYSYKNGMLLPEPPNLENGLYNLEMNLRGELDDGSTFERTLIRPLTQGHDIRELLKHTAKKLPVKSK